MRVKRATIGASAALAMTLGSAVFIGLAPASDAVSASPASALACADPNYENVVGWEVNDEFVQPNVPIRNGDNGTCPINGYGQPADTVFLHCFVINAQGVYWDHLRDETIPKGGWVNTVYLYFVSGDPC